MSVRVLVTRAEPGASETAERLKALHYQAIVEPVFAVEPLPANLPAFDALAFTSANGARVFAKLSPRRDAPVFCVGRRTAEAAREAGFANVTSADGNVADLGALIETRLASGSRMLHTGNEESRGDLARALSAMGWDAAFLATYRAIPAAHPGPALTAQLSGKPAFDAVLVHSPRGAQILKDFLAGKPGAAPFGLAAMSPAAAAPLAAFARRTEIAAAPDEKSLLAALDRLSLSG